LDVFGRGVVCHRTLDDRRWRADSGLPLKE
jgi:hypothetical protein